MNRAVGVGVFVSVDMLMWMIVGVRMFVSVRMLVLMVLHGVSVLVLVILNGMSVIVAFIRDDVDFGSSETAASDLAGFKARAHVQGRRGALKK